MDFIAHRGLVNEFNIENTKMAFVDAFNSDMFVGIELDLRVSSDGVFVIYHDILIDGIFVSSLAYRELKKKGVMKFEDILRIDTCKYIFVEIKSFDIDLNKLHKMLQKSKKNIYVMSFSNDVIKKLSKYSRNYKVGTLNYIINSEDDYSYNDFVCLLYLSVTENLINYFKDNNIEVVLYGILDNIVVRDYGVKMIVDYEYVKKLKI